MRGAGWVIMFVLVLIVVTEVRGAAFDPGQAFDKKCSSCHTIGGGTLKGPDLKGVTVRRTKEWLIKFIQSSDATIKSGDPQAVKLYNDFNQQDMPDQKLSDQEILDLLGFIEGGGQSSSTSLKIKPANTAMTTDILKGEALYLGTTALTNGGPACVSCHSIADSGPLGGGTLAKDLTHSFSTFSDKGMDVALEKLAFPVMDEVFVGKKLTEEEIFQIKSFLYQADLKGSSNYGYQRKFVFLGICGVVGSMGVIDFIWRRRRKGSVRKAKGGIR